MKFSGFIVFVFIKSVYSVAYTCDPNLSCGCSITSTIVTSKIIGGEIASNYAWTWMASLQLSNAHICGATLLTPEYAVTAAHCVYDIVDISTLSIVAGSNYLYDTNMQRRIITKVTVHPNFNRTTYNNDMAILQFSPLNTSSNANISFICLPIQGQDPFQTDSSLVAIGWGVTKVGSTTPASYLRQVTVQVFPSDSNQCKNSDIANTTLQFCAGVVGGGKGRFLSILLTCNLISFLKIRARVTVAVH